LVLMYWPRTWIHGTIDRLFGFDFFISYSRRDGTQYPTALAARLSKAGYDVFLDTNVYVAGDDLSAATVRRARMSSKLILIVRQHTFVSKWVQRELDAALSAQRDVIVVDINDSWQVVAAPSSSIFARISDRLRISEQASDFDGAPTDKTIGELTRSFNSTRRQVIRQRVTAATAGLMTVLAIAAGGFWWTANANKNEALGERDRALQAQTSLLAELSQRKTRDGNATDGALLALEALAAGKLSRRSSSLPKAEAALYLSLQNLHEERFLRHNGGVTKTGLGKKGELAFTAAANVVRLWRIRDWQLSGSISVPGRVSDAAFTRDESLIIIATDDGAVQVWDPKLPEAAVRICRNPTAPSGAGVIALEDTGKTILHTVWPDIVQLWNVADCGHILLKTGQTFDAAFSPDGKFIATGESGKVQIWDASTGMLLKVLPQPKLEQSDSSDPSVNRIRFSEDGRLLATADSIGRIALWDSKDRDWKAVGVEPIRSMRHKSWTIIDLAFDPSGRQLASADYDGNVFLWAVDSGSQLHRFQHGGIPSHLLFDEQSQNLVVTTGAQWFWGELLAQNDYPIRIWSLSDGQQATVLRGHTAPITSADMTGDKRQLITSSEDGSVRVWSLGIAVDKLKLVERRDVVHSATAEEKDLFVTVSRTGIVELRSGGNGLPLFTFALDEVPYEVALSANGERLAVLHSDVAELWSLTPTKRIDTFKAVEKPIPCTGGCRKLLSIALSTKVTDTPSAAGVMCGYEIVSRQLNLLN